MFREQIKVVEQSEQRWARKGARSHRASNALVRNVGDLISIMRSHWRILSWRGGDMM